MRLVKCARGHRLTTSFIRKLLIQYATYPRTPRAARHRQGRRLLTSGEMPDMTEFGQVVIPEPRPS